MAELTHIDTSTATYVWLPMARPPSEAVFEAGLDWLLDGIEP